MTLRPLRIAVTTLVAVAAGVAVSRAGQLPLAEELIPQLKPVLETAMHQSPRTVSRNLDLVIAENNRRQAEARQYPSFGGWANFYVQKEDWASDVPDRGFLRSDKAYYNISLTQPAWHWGTIAASVDIGRINEQMAKRNFSEANRLLALEVRNTYLRLVLVKMAVRNSTFVEKLARANVALQDGRLKAGQITIGEMMNHQLKLDEAVAQLRRDQLEFDAQLRHFRRLTGNTAFSLADLPDAVPAPAQGPGAPNTGSDSDYLASNALQLNTLELDRAKLEYRIAKYNLFPKFNFAVGTTQDQTSYFDDRGRKNGLESIYAGVQVNWTIFDGFSTRAQKRSALARKRQLELARADLIESLRGEAETRASQIDLAWRDYQNAAMRARFGREGLIFVRTNFDRGVASQDQVDASIVNANYTELQAQQALVGYLSLAAAQRSFFQADPYAAAPVNP